MKISMIAAMANQRVIGLGNKMPWHLPADLKFFKQNTTGKPVIMGRKTFQSIGAPLPNRTNIIITNDKTYYADNITVVHGIQEALAVAQGAEEVMIIGGQTIYEQFLPMTHELYLTKIDLDINGDAFFPNYQEVAKWQVNWSEKHLGPPYDFTFIHMNKL